MRHLIRSRRLFPHHDPPNHVILAFGVVVPHRYGQAAGAQLLGGDVEADRLVEHRVDGVPLDWRLLALDGTIAVAQRHLDEGIWLDEKNKTKNARLENSDLNIYTWDFMESNHKEPVCLIYICHMLFLPKATNDNLRMIRHA